MESVKKEGLWNQAEGSSSRLEKDTAAMELEVCKLQELVRKLEIQNEALNERKNNSSDRQQFFYDKSLNCSCMLKICPTRPEQNRTLSVWGDSEHVQLDSKDDQSPPDTSSMSRLGKEKGLFSHGNSCKDAFEGTLGQEGQEKSWEPETEEAQSALDLVEVLDVETCSVIKDEERWLYESQKKHAFVEGNVESPVKWCRKVLDNHSPETEVACRTLINMLDQNTRLRRFFNTSPYRHPVTFPVTHCKRSSYVGCNKSEDNMDQAFDGSDHSKACLALYSPPSKDSSELHSSEDSITMDYRLEDLTDVQIMARMQEESLRQDCASVAAPPRCSPVSQFTGSTVQMGHRNRSATQLPKYTHQVAQSKLLKLAQSRAALRNSMPNLDSAPRTSLRSLQAVRKSRCMEDNSQHPSDHTTLTYPVRPHSGAMPGNTGRSVSDSFNTTVYSVPVAGARNSLRESFQAASIRGLQRAQSLSPSNIRIQCPGKELSVKGYLSIHSRVYASPERSTTLAWGRIGQPARR
ncbi:SLAIN motif-containing protein-like isoform X1 [Hypomesus transpacificus]|uniref:SLAIN motif-containing protein-like isoform X1 n=1 Tax=Hypomesus transpacificus TaxID=137520 RepID=UPI001F079B7F|nr:SLAIN motif-containing protein-like isoform X1 [Hypomesus transpacificus]XP_046906358.1 SLAIN motif-containing protein-like isoform X1 [Hypomesus transpacificus]